MQPDTFLRSVHNPFTAGVVAFAGTAGLLAMTSAFAPMGVVGALGWPVAYAVAGATFGWELAAHRPWADGRVDGSSRRMLDR